MDCKRCNERPAAGIRGLCDPCHVSGGCATGSGWFTRPEPTPRPAPEGDHKR